MGNWEGAALAVAVLAAVDVVSRFWVRPDRRPRQIWIPAGIALLVLVVSLATEEWWLAGIAALVALIEICRTLPTWRALQAVRAQKRPRTTTQT